MEENEPNFSKEYLGWKPTFSIIIGVGWLIFLIAFLGFFAYQIDLWEKNLAIILLATLVAFSLIGGMWAAWGLKKIPKEGKEMFKTFGFKWRVQTSIIFPFAAMVFLILWFWFTAELFDIWQHIAVLLITLLAIGGILGSIWARWGMKNAWKFDKQATYYCKDEKKDKPKDEKD